MKRILLILTGLALASPAVAALAQTTPTGTLIGQVVGPDGLALAGVTVAVVSPALQGTRTALTSASGHYIIPFLPAGDYRVHFTLSGFRALEHKLRLPVGETATLPAQMPLAGVAETLVVTAGAPTDFGPGATVASSWPSGLIDKLPVGRDLIGAVMLAPGAAATGPNHLISISGAHSFESLYLIDGVVVNANLRGQPLDLFIEDAIEETKTSSASISAEYGRFEGGVVNVLTRSGGNAFGGSLRTTFSNDHWRERTPFEKTLAEDPRVDDVAPLYEATFGGPVLRDRLWFFGAGRLEDREFADSLAFVNVPYARREDEKRFEGKLTWALSPRHTFKGSYIYNVLEHTNRAQGIVMDRASLFPRRDPQHLMAINYTGILASRFFVEAQYSRRRFTFEGAGSRFTDLIKGTTIFDRSRGNAGWNSPTFCAVCGLSDEQVAAGKLNEEHRDNQNLVLKGSYFLSSGALGSHRLVFGLDMFDDKLENNNWLSGSGFRVFATDTIIRGGQLFPVFTPATSFIRWNPIFENTQGNRMRTLSLFLSDAWRFSERWSFNLGLRWDKNDGIDQSGTPVIDDGAVSPRLALAFDPRGDRTWTLNAGVARYVAGIANSIADAGSAGGRPAAFDFTYLGPSINADPDTPDPLPVEEALQRLFDWFFASGGTDRPLRGTPVFPGVNRIVGEGLVSPGTWEASLGVTRRLGSKGLVRLDGVWREFRDFYADRADQTTGKVADPTGRLFDLRIVTNTTEVKRNYRGASLQVSYHPRERLLVGGNYTLSRARGNFDGETAIAGPVTDTTSLFYPEYTEPRWNTPIGDLAVDQRHKLRLWLNYRLPVPVAMGRFDLSLLQQLDSGVAYSANGPIDTRPYVTNPGYVSPPATVAYYFGARGAFRTDTMTATDLSLNYARSLGVGRKTELFARFVLLNAFNGSAQVESGNETVLTNSTDRTLAPFNPFTETPVEGVHYRLGPQFGKAIEAANYQTPRTFSVALGLRF